MNGIQEVRGSIPLSSMDLIPTNQIIYTFPVRFLILKIIPLSAISSGVQGRNCEGSGTECRSCLICRYLRTTSGGGGIRTHGALLERTRFPVVHLRPTRSPLRIARLVKHILILPAYPAFCQDCLPTACGFSGLFLDSLVAFGPTLGEPYGERTAQ